MKRLLYTSSTLFFIIAVLFAYPHAVLANEGEGGQGFEMEVDGYHVTLASQNKWAKGENIIVVTLTDSMGMPVRNADVEVTAMPVENMPGHDESAGVESNTGGMSGMDMPTEAPIAGGMGEMVMATETPSTGVMRPNNEPASDGHDEEPIMALLEPAHESGQYSGEILLDKPGAWIFNVHFTINGEMLAAEFPVEIYGKNSKTAILWSFAILNAALVVTAGVMKKQKTVFVKGV
ncbi:MAG: FixH family protein [Chloroflexota bacterium]